MPTNANKLAHRLPCVVCEGAWFCYVICLLVPLGMTLALLASALISIR